MSKNYNQISKEILEYVGGKENIISAAHCATRLRLVLKDDKKINIKAIEEMPAVKGNFNTSGQFQIILGSGVVNEVYKELIKMADISEGSKEELKKEADKKLNPVQRLIKSLADVFVPVLPILVAAGLLMGINNILTSQGLFIEGQSLIEAHPQFKDLAEMINTFANTGFAFLPIFLGFSATKAFGGNPYLGACIGALMIHGDLLNGYSYPSAVIEGTVPYWNILGFSILKVGYQGTVLPVLASSFVLAKVEKTLHKIIPSVLDNLLTPLFTVFITGLLTFVAIGPVMRLAGDGITAVSYTHLLVISKYKLIDLINSSRKSEKITVRSAGLSFTILIASIVILVVAYYLASVTNLDFNDYRFLTSIFLGIIGTLGFFFGASSVLLLILKKSDNLYYNNLNTFTIRQITNKFNTNFISMAVICLMLFVTIGKMCIRDRYNY